VGSDEEDRRTRVGERLDPAGGVPSDGLERNWDGQTQEEFLEMLQSAHDDGSVQIHEGLWLGEDDAVVEIGAEEVGRRRAEMAAYLERAWAELDPDPGPDPG
jgi:hypothetical protein